MSEPTIAHEVLRSIRQIVRRISEHSRYLSREVGLTIPQLMCLKAIGEFEGEDPDGLTVARVAEAVQLSPATVSRIIDRLVRAGLIKRERSERDRRRVCLALTDVGLERFQTLPTPMQDRFVSSLMALNEGERATLLSALRQIGAMMDATDVEAAPMLTPEYTVQDASTESDPTR